MMEKDEVTQVLAEMRNMIAKKEDSKILDIGFKFMSTVSLAMVFWLFSTANMTQKDVVEIKSDNKYVKSSLDKLESFASQPIFTQDSYDTKTLPILNAITSISEAVRDIEKRLSASDLERQKLLIAIQALENKK